MKHCIFLVASIFYTTVICAISWPFSSNHEPSFTCHLERLGGTVPNDMCLVKDFFIRLQKHPDKPDEIQKLWIFYGQPGTGKTTSAKAIGTESRAQLVFRPVKDIISDTKGYKNITGEVQKLYEHAESVAQQQQPILIVIDDVDTLNKDQAREFFSSLRVQFDRLSENPFIVTILTSNSGSQIDQGIITRATRLEVPIPSKENRKAIIHFYAHKFAIDIPEQLVDILANKSENLTGRDIETAFIAAKSKSRNLKSINPHLILAAIQHILDEQAKNAQQSKKTWGAWMKDAGEKSYQMILAVGAIAAVIERILSRRKPDPEQPKPTPEPPKPAPEQPKPESPKPAIS